jgi:hypothetical protein
MCRQIVAALLAIAVRFALVVNADLHKKLGDRFAQVPYGISKRYRSTVACSNAIHPEVCAN